ncbi:glycosyltransferase family 2 protein [Haliscomenobacter hydrossis]|uniref:Glycosyl transferase family 2 n=1 Tax=Haliscomenobacter hydrossis (strain ATCC 27775 / DSM 1100 / LMG 10767 / O) TaxID=760192 RepID=F4L5F2_HALH1|nr:glycosyltransferase family A protein [Haliscomenobacter hydrossis]AEE50816.1 glycosyl transferase family 2 [Haliscomenobacter hydrossis DSM 1100]
MRMNKPSISVLMAVYNTDFVLLKRAIDSVLQQTFQDFELLIIDDGSTNDEQNLLLDYVKRHEDKITYFRHKNCGQARSINLGIFNSKGEYITILDGDDEYKPNHLEACIASLGSFDLIASNTHMIVDTEDDYYVPDRFDNTQMIHLDECIIFATLFGKKEVFADIQFKDGYAADADFYERAGQKYSQNKVDLRTYIYYRNYGDSTCDKLKKAVLSTFS